MKIYFNISKYPYEGLLSKGIRLSGPELRILSWKGKRCFVSRSEAHKVKDNTFYEGDLVELEKVFLIKNIVEQSPALTEKRTELDTVSQFPEIIEIRSQYLFTEYCVSDEPRTISMPYGYKTKENYISEEVQAYVGKFDIDLATLISSADEKEKVFWLDQPTLREFDVWVLGKRTDLFKIEAVYNRAGLSIEFRPAEEGRPAQHQIYCRYSESKKVQVSSYRQMTTEECSELSLEQRERYVAIDVECDNSKYVLYVETYFDDDEDCWGPRTKVLKFEKR